MRVIADHIRTIAFAITDGQLPSNAKAGYVIRRILRRAVRYGYTFLGRREAFMYSLLPVLIETMGDAYPELIAGRELIAKVMREEEESFLRTLETGIRLLDKQIEEAKKAGKTVLDGHDAFVLYDTYGFPLDLTALILTEQGLSVDEAGFDKAMQEQKERARNAAAIDAGDWQVVNDGSAVRFVGYDTLECTTEILRYREVKQKNATFYQVVLSETPFYAEMGGPLAHHGTIRLSGGGVVEVHDVQAPIRGLSVHRGTLTEGGMTVGEKAYAEIDGERRLAIARAHTATHMVYAGLRNVVSENADQAGSENSPSRLRFDFRHSSALAGSQLNDIEALVNEKLAEDLPVTTEVMSIEKAKEMGAIALFGEKYGSEVRVVTIGDGFDRELCGGTHVPTPGHIGRVTVLGEGSVASGVRRIEALVGDGAYEFQAKEHALVSQLSQLVGGRADELPERIESLLAKLRESEKELDKIRTEQALRRGGELAAASERVGKVSLVASAVGEMPSADALRTLALDVRDRMGNERGAVVALAGLVGGKPSLVIATNEGAREASVKAGALVRAVGKYMGGGGGGRDDIAQGGGTKPEGIPTALDAIRSQIEAL